MPKRHIFTEENLDKMVLGLFQEPKIPQEDLLGRFRSAAGFGQPRTGTPKLPSTKLPTNLPRTLKLPKV